MTTNLGTVAADVAMKSAVEYMSVHNLEADLDALTECIRFWCKSKLPQAIKDASDAYEANMPKIAEATFIATMRLAGIEAAKEAGFPKAGHPVKCLA